MIALSTSWNSTKLGIGPDILYQIRDMGFESAELDDQISQEKFSQMLDILGREIQIVSIQNFFPFPDIFRKIQDIADISLSSLDKEKREMAVKLSLKTLETADSIDTRAVVFRLGQLDIDDPYNELINLYRKDGKESIEYVSLLQKAKDVRKSNIGRYLDSIFFSLDKLADRAESLGITIGIENCLSLSQIPNYDEIRIMLGEFKGANMGYWHNTGYSYIHEKLDIAHQEDILKEFSDKMVGVYLSDVKDFKDSLVPGFGEIDFKNQSQFISEKVIKVMKVDPESTQEEICEGLSHLKSLSFAK